MVDDQIDIVELVVDFLRDEGYQVTGVTDGITALSLIESERPRLVLLDMLMPQMTGMELWQHLQQQYNDTAVVLMTASPSLAESLLPQPQTDYLAKPFDLDQLLDCVARYVNPAPNPAYSPTHPIFPA